MLPGVIACFLLSGFAALLYQTAWLRQFSLVFGTSELAVATVLAAYMAGLALGAAVAARFVGRIRRPVRVYGLLEAGIALSALAVPWLLELASRLYGLALGGSPNPPDAHAFGQPVFYLLVAIVVLAIPTSFMGATLPLLIRHAVTRDRELGPRVAWLYAVNTGGAVLGALAAGFVLLPALGLRDTVFVGVGVNALVFALAAAISRRAPPRDGASEAAPGRERAAPPGERASWILPAMLVSGATSFAYEVLWTRLLTHILGGSIYAFTAMLATFLSGIAIGSAVAGRLAAQRAEAARAFAFAQLGIALLSIGVYAWMGPLLPEGRAFPALVLYAIAVMLPATLFIGATFPLAVRVVARDEREAGSATARVYAWNTVGAIAGSVLTGFWLLPALGFGGTVKLAIAINGLLAALAFAAARPPRRRAAGAVLAGLVAAALLYHPGRPEAVLAPAAHLPWQLAPPRETFYAVGRSATVLVVDTAEEHWMLTNGAVQASVSSRGSPPDRDAQSWLTALAIAARPASESLLVVGLGGGSGLAGAPPSVRRIDVVEIEREVLRANRSLSGIRAWDPLADERVRVVVNDARNALRLTSRRYDAIVSQPSHPWTAGASHLFTREFARSAKQHLEAEGVFVQWMSSDFLTAPLLRSLVSTLLAEFRHLRLYRPSPDDLLFLASDGALDVEREILRSGRPLADHPAHYRALGIASVEDLVAALVAEGPGLAAFAGEAPRITDDRNLMATHSRGGGLSGAEIDALFAPHDPLLDPEAWVHGEAGAPLHLPHVARRLLRMGKPERARALSRAMPAGAARHRVEAELHADAGREGAALAAARAAVAADPGDEGARYLALRLQLAELLAEGDPERGASRLAGLGGTALAVGRGWLHARDRDWSALAALDAELARSEVTDAWYPDAALLRARWRTQAGRERPRLVAEALALVDGALLLARDIRLHRERLRIALLLGDDAVLVESARSLTGVYVALLRAAGAGPGGAPGSRRPLMRQNLDVIARALERDFAPVHAFRAGVVRGVARELLDRLGGPLAPPGGPRPAAR